MSDKRQNHKGIPWYTYFLLPFIFFIIVIFIITINYNHIISLGLAILRWRSVLLVWLKGSKIYWNRLGSLLAVLHGHVLPLCHTLPKGNHQNKQNSMHHIQQQENQTLMLRGQLLLLLKNWPEERTKEDVTGDCQWRNNSSLNFKTLEVISMRNLQDYIWDFPSK